MAGVSSDEAGGVGSSVDGDFSDQQPQCLSGEALVEWRSSEQLENGILSTSTPYWDSDDQEDGGPKPVELYGKYTWKIDKFSQINKRELRSNPFEVGGYKWYILIYPQGCDACNHLSLFLCVANHDKLLPGWSHFAQFTIAVVNKDPKKSKYSDTLHRFWKKEHDWGWKKFMELSKVFDGFIDSDTLIIKAQVQVIRERSDRPFWCLDCQYRRELIRVYLTNVEQICRRFVEERRNKLGKLIEDKARWSSFCAFWLSMDNRSRHHLSQEKTDSILKVVVKHFFIEKEVTSTLVMDSLVSGLKALERPYKEKKTKSRYSESEDLSVPIIRVENDMFVLVDDVLPLLERATIEPFPPKDEMGPQNRAKDWAAGEEIIKDYIQRDERRLTELGRRTIEIFILAHIFSKIEVAYQEAVALKKQEELIREEEAALLAETEQKSRRGSMDKEKKSKKKQGKQKRNNRKGKDRGRDDSSSGAVQVDIEQNDSTTESKDPRVSNEDMALDNSVAAEDISDVSDSVDFATGRIPPDSEGMTVEKSIVTEDVSDVSDSVDFPPKSLPPDSEDHVVNSVSWDIHTSEAHPTAGATSSGDSGLSSMQTTNELKSSTVVDDSLFTSSSDSFPSMSHESNSPHLKSKYSPNRRARSYQPTQKIDSIGGNNEENINKSEAGQGAGHTKDLVRTPKGVDTVPPATDHPPDNVVADGLEHPAVKEEEVTCCKSNSSGKDAAADAPGDTASFLKYTLGTPSKQSASVSTKMVAFKFASNPLVGKKLSPDRPDRSLTSVSSVKSVEKVDSKVITQKSCAPENINALKTNTQKSATPENLVTFKANAQKFSTPKPVEMIALDGVHHRPEKLVMPVTTDKFAVGPNPMPVVSRPYSAPLVPCSRLSVPTPTVVPASPVLDRSASVTGRLGPESSVSATQSYVPQSYRNAVTGDPGTGSSSTYPQNHSTSSLVNSSMAPLVSGPPFSQFGSDRMDINPMKPVLSFGMVNHDSLQKGRPVWLDSGHRDGNRNLLGDYTSLSSDARNFDVPGTHQRRQDNNLAAAPVRILGRQNHKAPDGFPHLDIINDLLDDENGGMNPSVSDFGYQSFRNGQSTAPPVSYPYGFPDDTALTSSSTVLCRFDRTRSFSDDRFQYNYSIGTSIEARRDMNSLHHPHSNGQVTGSIPSQWQRVGPEIPFRNTRISDNANYPFHQSLSLGSSGFPVYRPSNGM